jgi:hypothetical protein
MVLCLVPKSALESHPYNHATIQVNLIMTQGKSLHSNNRADHVADERYSGQRRGDIRPSHFSVYLGQDGDSQIGVAVDLDPQNMAFIPC